jgi:hypothetical protein
MARDDPECLPSSGTLRRIRWPLQPRSRDRLVACAERNDRWMTLSRHPGPAPIRAPLNPMPFDVATPFRSEPPPTFHRRRLPRARPPFTRVVALFGAPCASVFEAKRRLATSATANRRTSNPTGALDSSQGRRPQPPSFSDVPRCHRQLPASADDTRRAARRPLEVISVPVPPTCVGLPDRDTTATAPPPSTRADGVE